MHITVPPGRIDARNVTLKELLLSFSKFAGIVEGGPKWVESDHYDIVAKAEGQIANADRAALLLSLLQDRFKLAFHVVDIEQNGLALTKGVQMPDVKPTAGGRRVAGVRDESRKLLFTGVLMPELALWLANMMGVPVVDRTRMEGAWDFTLDPDSFAATPTDHFRELLRPATEALGFKLIPTKVTHHKIVIDHVERPEEN